MLFLRWRGDTGIISKLFGSSIFAFGAFIIIWWFISASIAPLFAARDSKEARNAVRIIGYWPNDQVVKLSFENEKLVEMIGKVN